MKRYSIISFNIDDNGRHSNYETVVKNIPTEERALSWLKSCRQASINVNTDRHVTEIGYWCYNVLESTAKGDRAIQNFHIIQTSL